MFYSACALCTWGDLPERAPPALRIYMTPSTTSFQCTLQDDTFSEDTVAMKPDDLRNLIANVNYHDANAVVGLVRCFALIFSTLEFLNI